MSPQFWHLYVPKFFIALREGYGFDRLRMDLVSGLTVAIVAFPLAMALAIASGTTPDRGLYTAIVAGFLISFLGGSRHQIGGPTGAFVVVVFNVIQTHGYDGLVLATLLAGVILILAGALKLGNAIKYIPFPVVTGFTAGIAVIIFSSQVKEFLGLRVDEVPAELFDKWVMYATHLDRTDMTTFVLAATTLVAIFLLRKYSPKLPGFLLAIVAGALLVWGTGLEVETIGSRFGGLPSGLPEIVLPAFSWEKLMAIFPSAVTIAFLAGIESLLSAVVADGMTGRRHRSNCELVAQGVANIASVALGGIPATGAIARTATNIKSGGQTPVAGMSHAVFLLLFTLLFAPLARWIPLASLAAVLVVVAWNMSEVRHFRHLMSAPVGDRLVLLTTFGLTIFVDLTVAIEVGIVMAAIMFMKRMSDVTEIEFGTKLMDEDVDDLAAPPVPSVEPERELPHGVEMFQINGPFFFGVATHLNDVLDRISESPEIFILRMRRVPVVDATGLHALEEFHDKCTQRGTDLILCGVQPQPRQVLARMGLDRRIGREHIVEDSEAAIRLARRILWERRERLAEKSA